jgi:2-polyprenyl-3-methyl-5-hydroxy-6-metoxy-1,4-benzoquinol methylase
MTKTPTDYEYTYQSPTIGHHHHYLAPPVLQALANLQKNPTQPLKLLDLGCGNGSFSSFLANQGFVVTGIEASASGVAQAQQAYPNCRFRQGSIYDLDLTDLRQSFDIVLSAEVIEHLLYPKELVRVAKQCLRPGGTLVLTTPYHGYLKNLTLALTGKLDSHFTALWDGGHIKFFSVPTLRQLVLNEGFINPQFEFAGRFPYLWKSMICAATLPLNANAS